MQRAINTYREKGYSEEWITQRMRIIETRKELTAEWNRVGVEEGVEYATLTDDISKTWSRMSTKEYKQYKGLKKGRPKGQHNQHGINIKHAGRSINNRNK